MSNYDDYFTADDYPDYDMCTLCEINGEDYHYDENGEFVYHCITCQSEEDE